MRFYVEAKATKATETEETHAVSWSEEIFGRQ